MQHKTYSISIGEPWDFTSPDGDNIINCLIIRVLSSKCLLFRANYTLDFDGVSGDILILSPRFNDGNFENIVTEEIDVNGGLFLGDYEKKIEESKLKENSKFVLIGSLKGGKGLLDNCC